MKTEEKIVEGQIKNKKKLDEDSVFFARFILWYLVWVGVILCYGLFVTTEASSAVLLFWFIMTLIPIPINFRKEIYDLLKFWLQYIIGNKNE
jgi:hypothetical protein